MGDLLSLPKQAAYQDVAQPGAIPPQRIAETSFYRNQIDRGFPRVDHNEYRSVRQDSFTVFRSRDASYPVDGYRGAVDDREYVCRPSTPTICPTRIPRPFMPCPLISITSDNEISSVIYQNESDESDDKIIEEDEINAEQGEISHSNYSTLSPFERITPPREYAEPAHSKHSLLAPPLAFDRNFYDTIPYIDQSDDANLTETFEPLNIQTESTNEREHCNEVVRGNSNLREDSQKHVEMSRNPQGLNIAHFELHVQPDNFTSSAIDIPSFPTNKSALSVGYIVNGSSIAREYKIEDFQCASNSTECALRVENEDKSDNVINSEDCADESSSTINDDCASSRVEGEIEEEGISTPKMYTIMPELHLDLTGLNSDASSDDSKTEKCWKSPEEVRLGCGRVAALAKHFSKLGDAGLIRFKSTKLTDSRQFVSEPDITTPEKSDEYLHGSCHAQKEYKSDSDLTRDDNSRIDSIGRHKVILFDAEDDSFAIQECRFHRCGAKRVTVARIPSWNDFFAMKNTTLAQVEDYNDMAIDNSKSQDLETETENHENEPADNDNTNKLSREQQQVIVEQLEQFSNLDNTDAPLFIPDQNEKQISLASKNQNKMLASVDSINQSTPANRVKTISPGKSLLINMDDSFQRTKDKTTSSPSSVRSPSSSCSSIALSPSNIAKTVSPFSQDAKIRPCGKHFKSRLLDRSHSSAKNCSNNGSSEHLLMLPPRESACSRPNDKKLNILRVRIVRPLCSSEDNLISGTVCGEKSEEVMDRHDGFIKLSCSYDSILNSKLLLDSADQMQRESFCKTDDSFRESCDESSLATKQKSSWHHSLEELKSKREPRKQDSSMNFASIESAKIQTRLSKSFDDKLNSKDEEETRWNRHGSLEESKSDTESYVQDNWTNLTNSGRIVETQRFDWTPEENTARKKRYRTKYMSHDHLKSNALDLYVNGTRDERQEWKVVGKSQSELDIPRRKFDSEKNRWNFREINSLKDDDRSGLRKQHPYVMH